jgi:hypothetical protein
MVIGGYFINGYCWLNYHKLFESYSISGYYWLFYYRPLVVILSMAIDDYSIDGY